MEIIHPNRLPKRERQKQLQLWITENPFVTDEELTERFQVSIQTIRLDRMEQGIPELRERLKSMAEQSLDDVRSLPLNEVIGEVIDLQLNSSGISILDIRLEHTFSRTKVARGHHLFAQANSLAVAVIDDEVALTAAADIRFIRPVRLGERCIAKAKVTSISDQSSRARVDVQTYIGDEVVFTGQFLIYRALKEDKFEGSYMDADRY